LAEKQDLATLSHQARNLWVLEKGGELVYYTGTVVIIYHRMEETQRHYTGHTEDVTCLDVHPQVLDP
jgi:microtubule-associated protein-like 1/2